MGAFMMNGVHHHGREHTPVHRAVHTPGLHGIEMGTVEMGNVEMGGIVYGDPGPLDTVKDMLTKVKDYVVENWMMIALVGGGAAIAWSMLKKPATYANRRRKGKKGKKGHGRKGHRTAAQIRASKRNLAKGRKAAAARKGHKGHKARKAHGRRKVTPYNRLWGKYRKMGYSATEAARLAKGGKVKGGKGRSRSRSRSRSRR
jgi:hypothetical protein